MAAPNNAFYVLTQAHAGLPNSVLFATAFAAEDLANLGTKSHTVLSDIGTNAHSVIDTHIANTAIHFTDTFWDVSDNQTGLTGDKTGTFALTTTGNCAFGNVEPFTDDTYYLGHQSWRWKGLFLSGDANIGGTIDFGTNTITDGTMTGDWDLGAGDLSATILKATNLIQANKIRSIGTNRARFELLSATESLSFYGKNVELLDFGGKGKSVDININPNNEAGVMFNIFSDAVNPMFAMSSNTIAMGDGGVTNYHRIDTLGNMKFFGLAVITGAKWKITTTGGYAIKLTNKTGAVTVAGQLVQTDTSTNDAVKLTGIDEEETIGVFEQAGIADGNEAWVVINGIADVAMEDDTAATRGNWVRSSITEAGYADATNAAPPSPAAFSHFNEIGNCIETVAAAGGGTHILARCVLHFN